MKTRVGIRIRAIRREKLGSQAKLAEAIGRSVETVSSIERGKSLPNFETLERLASALEVPIKDFFEFEGAGVSPKREAMLAEINAVLATFPDRKLATAAALIRTLKSH